MKCDETRPACLRCLRISDTTCKGYEYTAIPRHVAERRVLLPLSALRATPALSRGLESQDEAGAFRTYCEKVAPRLSYTNDEVWQRLLLQAGQENEFIRNAIFAIGSFSRRADSSRSPGEGYTGTDAAKSDKVALAQYGKFLEGTKKYIARTGRKEGRRLAMIACLLVVCIENMQYRPHNALVHAQQGLKLVEEISEDQSEQKSLSRRAAADTIEVELLQQFSRLDLQIVGCYDIQSRNVHRKLKGEGANLIREMPAAFSDIQEASEYLDLVMRRAFHFMAYTNLSHKAQFKFGLEDGTSHEMLCLSEDERRPHATPYVVQIEHEIYVSEIRRWDHAFERMLNQVLWNPNHPNTTRALMMKVHSITTSLSLADHLSTSELHWDKLMPEFKNLVYLCKKLLEHPAYVRGQFAFDMGLIYPLIIPTLNCRDRRLRREAIDLLSESPWREAHWDSSHAADVAKFVMQVEEEGVETDFIPEWARVKSFGIDIQMNTGIVRLSCLRGVGGAAVTVEGTMDWSDT